MNTRPLTEYANVSQRIGLVVSCRFATLGELSTILGAEDLHNLVEIAVIDANNRRVLSEKP